MAKQRKLFITHAGELAHRLVRTLRPHGMIADFARTYARSYNRVGVVDEPQRLRELESTLGREAVLVMVAEVGRQMPAALGARKGRPLDAEEAAFARMFWPEFMTALGRALEWEADESASEREAFDRDLLMYRRWSERAPFPSAPLGQEAISPFLDRCALLLDPSTMEEARMAAADFEKELMGAAGRVLGHLGRTGDEKPPTKKSPAPSRRPTPPKLSPKPKPSRKAKPKKRTPSPKRRSTR